MAHFEDLQNEHRRNTIVLKAIEIIAEFHRNVSEAYRLAIAAKMAEITKIKAPTEKLRNFRNNPSK